MLQRVSVALYVEKYFCIQYSSYRKADKLNAEVIERKDLLIDA